MRVTRCLALPRDLARAFLVLFVVCVGVSSIRPALAVEDGLMGVRIGASYRELTRRFGTPHGILLGTGGSMMYQTMSRPQAGLPQFGGQAAPSEMPVWVNPVLVGSLAAGQAEWFYDYRSKKGVAVGIVLNGEGSDAAVIDVVVAGFDKYLKGKPTPVRSQRGIALQSTFADVLRKYGYPPLIEIYTPGGGGGGARAAGGAMRAAGGGGRGGGGRGGGARGGGGRGGGGRGGGGMRAGGGRGGGGGGGRGGGGGGRGGGGRGGRGGRASAAGPALASAPASISQQYELVLTGGRRGGGGGGGGRGGGGRGGGMRGGGGGGRGGGGRGGLPPLGAAGAAAAAGAGVTGFSDTQAVAFSRDCILTYEGIAFTVQDMRVMRIHVSE